MEIKTPHLQLDELKSLESQLAKHNLVWDKGAVGKNDAVSPTRWVDGVMSIPSQGKGQVTSLVWLDYDETVIWDKSPENAHYNETEMP